MSRKYDQYEDYDEYYEEKPQRKSHSKSKEKFKGHQSRQSYRKEKWENLQEEYTDSYATEREKPLAEEKPRFERPRYQPAQTSPSTTPRGFTDTKPFMKRERIYGPNTHEVGKVKIDFDGVIDIQAIEGEPYNGRPSYGIKFFFLGRNNPSAVSWFGARKWDRDKAFEAEKQYWMGLESYKKRIGNQ